MLLSIAISTIVLEQRSCWNSAWHYLGGVVVNIEVHLLPKATTLGE